MTFDDQGTVAITPYIPIDQRVEEEQGLTWRTPALSQRHHHAILVALRSGEPRCVRAAVEADIEESGTQLLAKAIFEDGPGLRLRESDRLLVPAV